MSAEGRDILRAENTGSRVGQSLPDVQRENLA